MPKIEPSSTETIWRLRPSSLHTDSCAGERGEREPARLKVGLKIALGERTSTLQAHHIRHSPLPNIHTIKPNLADGSQAPSKPSQQ
ncbi:hypothetical protein DB330_05535 [Lacticaseibacillus casei]|nr:hypothetical protein [Lacticaseibacillus casei]PTU96592.1 hypothetical protein DB330_05535 [Lacticaseibacillus casei]PTU98787.1 hypothetical protein DB326_05490 [Lacticaseibacillus casei]RXS57664.1 hypothetical protein ETB94_05410 [Lacticaseibacillus casei]TLF34831.1 hypothetical protein FEI10_05555 [Lacticaseibacillus casei]